jgi:hypothetical protein
MAHNETAYQRLLETWQIQSWVGCPDVESMSREELPFSVFTNERIF